MSDTPLFQDADEREAVYAPQQLPHGSDELTPERDAAPEDADTASVGAVPIPTAGVMGSGVGMGGTGASGGAVSGIGPAIGAAALGDEAENEETRDPRP